MDYETFFKDVVHWIGQANEAAICHGMDKEEFWDWVVGSCSSMCKKHQDNRLAVKQMVMMFDWLDEVHKSQK